MRLFLFALIACVLVISTTGLLTGCAGRRTSAVATTVEMQTPREMAASRDPSARDPSPVASEYYQLTVTGLSTFEGSEVSGWRLARSVDTYDRKSIFDYIDGAAELYFAYNFRAVATAEYQKANAPETSIIIDVYDMTTPEGAFGIYSLNRYPGANYVNVGNEGILSGASLDFWKGRYFCKVYSLNMAEKYQSDVISFGNKLSSRIQEMGEEPSILGRLPQNGLLPRTAKFFSMKLGLDNIHFVSEENVLNLGADTKGAVAEYQVNNTEFKVFVIEYLSPERAVLSFEAYSKYLAGKGETLPPVEPGATHGKSRLVKIDGKLTFIKIKDKVLSGFWDIETREVAESVLKSMTI